MEFSDKWKKRLENRPIYDMLRDPTFQEKELFRELSSAIPMFNTDAAGKRIEFDVNDVFDRTTFAIRDDDFYTKNVGDATGGHVILNLLEQGFPSAKPVTEAIRKIAGNEQYSIFDVSDKRLHILEVDLKRGSASHSMTILGEFDAKGAPESFRVKEVNLDFDFREFLKSDRLKDIMQDQEVELQK